MDKNIFLDRTIDRFSIIEDDSLDAKFVDAITEKFTVTKLQAYEILVLAKLYAKNLDK